MIIHDNCRHFRGDIPCKPHKKHGVHCESCTWYQPKSKKILIIKLGALGDVIRTTPLLHKIWKEYPDASVWWLTLSPEIVPSEVDVILKFGPAALLRIQNTGFDTVINLDKDPEACALASMLNVQDTRGFVLRNGKPAPADERAYHKFLTGLFDDENQKNTKSYPEEIFEICGWKFEGEEYILDPPPPLALEITSEGKPIIGLNTGCGGRWTSRLWDEKRWQELIIQLQKNGYCALLLGGEQEHEKNSRLAHFTGALYLGYFSFEGFLSLVNNCDVIVSGVTMAMHVAIGLKKPLILFVNIFNPNEFELYGRGEILQPLKPCQCFFQPTCINKEYQCMESLNVTDVFHAIQKVYPAPNVVL